MFEFLKKYKNVINIVSVLYSSLLFYLITYTSFFKSLNVTIFVIILGGYPCILLLIFQFLAEKLGTSASLLMATDKRSLTESRYLITGAIPIFGIPVLSFRISHLINELDQKIKSGEVKL